ncbi:MAG: hypothetical protein M0Z39_09150 [Actinomycetota bacterium]|jgi:hypothetical protein|nr:hypothetical protein [Actinomycetota bacterium]
MEDGELVQLTSEQVERVFWSKRKFEPGLGIIETGFVAGGLSSLFSIGFELLGFATAEIEPRDLVIKCASVSRSLGGTAQELADFIPTIPTVDRSNVLSFGGRLDGFSTDGLFRELGVLGAVSFVRSYLCEFLDEALRHYVSRCDALSDKSFSRALSGAQLTINEAREIIDPKSLGWDGRYHGKVVNLQVFEEILDLSWLE